MEKAGMPESEVALFCEMAAEADTEHWKLRASKWISKLGNPVEWAAVSFAYAPPYN